MTLGVADTRERTERVNAEITAERKLYQVKSREAGQEEDPCELLLRRLLLTQTDGALRGTERLDKFIRVAATRELMRLIERGVIHLETRSRDPAADALEDHVEGKHTKSPK